MHPLPTIPSKEQTSSSSWQFFFRAQAEKFKISNLCGVSDVSYSISLAGLWYKYSLPEYISPSVLDRRNPSKRQACKILNILWNLSEVNHLIFRDFAIYKSQPIKPTSQAVTAVVCQTFFIGKKHDHPYIYHLFGVSTRGSPGLYCLIMTSTNSLLQMKPNKPNLWFLYHKSLVPTTRDRK